MFGFSLGETVDAASAPHAQYLGLLTPVRYDAGVLQQLEAQWSSLRQAFEYLVLDLRRDDARSAGLVAQSCAKQLHELQCQEALRVFPVISHHLTDDPEGLRQLSQERLELNRLARRFLRLLDELAGAIGRPNALEADIAHARGLLESCLEDRRYSLYRLYAAV